MKKEVAGYKILKAIAEGSKTYVYRALDRAQQPVILKVLHKEFTEPDKIARFQREYEHISAVNSDFVIQVYDFFREEGTLFMVMEDFQGTSLKEWIHNKKPVVKPEDLKNILQIVRYIALGLSDIHSVNLLHRDVNPSNIIYNEAQNQLKLIDFGVATEASVSEPDSNDVSFESTYPYMSPEQTGRLNRNTDYRTDYYSLGVTIYEMLTGEFPFQANSPREWIHCHLAKEPVPLNEVNPEIPECLSRIVHKLLRKSPDERYQSHFGLLKDLEICMDYMHQPDHTLDFIPGQYDFSRNVEIPDKLYGREEELLQIMEMFHTIKKGSPACLMVKGYSGVGKTSLVKKIKRRVKEDGGTFISGKFEQFKNEVPFSALTSAFEELIHQLIAQSAGDLNYWREKIHSAIPRNAQIIVEVIPELEVIIGEQPQPDELPAAEARQRFDVTFQKFFQLFVEPGSPLVIFLDDLQWADRNTLEMTWKLLKASEKKPVLLIGAYRENEISEGHPLAFTMTSLDKSAVRQEEMKLEPLQVEDIQRVLADTFRNSEKTVQELALVCHRKTQGNPFFLIEFLSDLFHKQFVQFDSSKGTWIWDIQKIKNTTVSENVADLISQRIKALPEDSREVLTMASCIGLRFDLTLLSKILNRTFSKVFAALKIPLMEYLILPDEQTKTSSEHSYLPQNGYQFLHDRVHQAIYDFLSEEKKARIHLKVGRMLQDIYSEKQVEDHLFQFIGHFNKGIAFLEANEKKWLAGYNLRAAKKAKASGVYASAYYFAATGFHLLPEETWKQNYPLMFTLCSEAAETAALNGKHGEMEQLLTLCQEHAGSILDQSRIHEIRTQSLIAQNKQQEAIQETLTLLKGLGIRFPSRPRTFHVLIQLFKTRSLLGRMKRDDIASLPEMRDSRVLTAMRNMAGIISVLYRTDPNLFSLIVFKLIRLTLKHGVAPISPVSFITFGLLTNAIFGNIPKAYDLGKIGMHLFDRIQGKKHWAQASYIYNVGVAIWKESLHDCNNNLLEAYKAARDTGDFEYMMSAAAARAHYLFRAGEELNDLVRSTMQFRESISHVYKEITYSQFDVLIQMFRNFMEPGEKPEELISDFYDERQMIEYHQKDQDETSLFMIYLDKLTLAYYFERYEQAYDIMQKARTYISGVAGLLMQVNYYYFESLVLLAQYKTFSSVRKQKAKRKIQSNQKKMKKWALHAPMNFKGKWKLIEAEKEGVMGNAMAASHLYEEAIEWSHTNGFVHEEALANELTAKFWEEQGHEKMARYYFSHAYQLYNMWGAFAKARDVKIKHPGLHTYSVSGNASHHSSETSASGQLSLSVDIDTLLEASKTISSEIQLEELMKKILFIILEHAGAQKGMLLMKDQGTWIVEANGEVSSGHIKVNLPREVLSSENVPLPVIHYVERTTQLVILHNAAVEGNFTGDSFINKNKVKSVAALPISQQGELLGILYLENNLTSHLFTEDRVNVLSVLCTQAAVSLQNATLYNTLEQKVRQRTEEVINQKEELIQQSEELKTINDQLKTLNNTKDKLFSIIAHDLRNPFNIILGHSNILREDFERLEQEEIRDSIEYIDNSSRNAYELLQNLLEWSRSQIGRIESDPTFIKLYHLVEKSLNLQLHMAESKEIQLLNLVSEEVLAFADEDMIHTTLRNLVSNAIKFTPRGGKIEVTGEIKEDFVEVTVEDNGIGIKQENISKLFSLEESYSTSGTEEEQGTGLGLILCKDFVQRNNGDIYIESESGKGTRFIIRLPHGNGI